MIYLDSKSVNLTELPVLYLVLSGFQTILHTTSVGICVKLVSEASRQVYGKEEDKNSRKGSKINE